MIGIELPCSVNVVRHEIGEIEIGLDGSKLDLGIILLTGRRGDGQQVVFLARGTFLVELFAKFLQQQREIMSVGWNTALQAATGRVFPINVG